LGIILTLQLCTGLLLVFIFIPSSLLSFGSVDSISREVFSGQSLRVFHLNGGSFFFLLLFLHIFKGLVFKSFRLFKSWGVGVIIFLVSMGTAFLGYVLPWGQISFWGAMVITNLISLVPRLGIFLVNWFWGGYYVNTFTLTFFFGLHFILPFLLLILVFFHLLFLHEGGRTGLLGGRDSISKVPFQPFFI